MKLNWKAQKGTLAPALHIFLLRYVIHFIIGFLFMAKLGGFLNEEETFRNNKV